MVTCNLEKPEEISSVFINDEWTFVEPGRFRKILFDANGLKAGNLNGYIDFSSINHQALQASLEAYVSLGKVNPFALERFTNEFSEWNRKKKSISSISTFFSTIAQGKDVSPFDQPNSDMGGSISYCFHNALFYKKSFLEALDLLASTGPELVYKYAELMKLSRNAVFSSVWGIAREKILEDKLVYFYACDAKQFKFASPTGVDFELSLPSYINEKDVRLISKVLSKIITRYNVISLYLGLEVMEGTVFQRPLSGTFCSLFEREIIDGLNFIAFRYKEGLPQTFLNLFQNIKEAREDKGALTHPIDVTYDGRVVEDFDQRGVIATLRSGESFYISRISACPFRTHSLRKINLHSPLDPDYINREKIVFVNKETISK